MRWTVFCNEVEKIAAHIDILPTLADIAGIDKLPNKQIEGRSLVPLLKTESSLGRPLSIHSESKMEDRIRAEQAPMESLRGT